MSFPTAAIIIFKISQRYDALLYNICKNLDTNQDRAESAATTMNTDRNTNQERPKWSSDNEYEYKYKSGKTKKVPQ